MNAAELLLCSPNFNFEDIIPKESIRCQSVFKKKTSINLMYSQNLIRQFCWWLFALKKAKINFCWKTVIFMLFICYHFVNWTGFSNRLNLGIFLLSTSILIFHLWKEVNLGAAQKSEIHHGNNFRTKIKSALKNLAKFYCESPGTAANFPQNSDICHYFSTKRRYSPLFCYELPGIFLFFFHPHVRLYRIKMSDKSSARIASLDGSIKSHPAVFWSEAGF